ncbi:single-stranded-DNA-specific exonuclease RecJ [Candidatus Gottesmanbacteria bacterium]|nr:single-stranded-DNA-specific exonuclease RecJ [Candidatus Gottesmanbacteria bacterium]
MKKWRIEQSLSLKGSKNNRIENIKETLLGIRGISDSSEIELFLHPPSPYELTAEEVGIKKTDLARGIKRILEAHKKKESIVVYADYDADGVTAGAIMWEMLHSLGCNVMPYIPHRIEEGYGLSEKGIDKVQEEFHPSLIITVDHGITAHEKVVYAKNHGIDVIVTDHHVLPDILPDCPIVHTTKLCGAGVSWFVAKEVAHALEDSLLKHPLGARWKEEILALACIGTIADMVPIIGPNRSIVWWGLASLRSTTRVGLLAIIEEAGFQKEIIGTYEISHYIAPRLNAMGRLDHAIDALRLLCTRKLDRARALASSLGETNKERQGLTVDTLSQAKTLIPDEVHKLIFLGHRDFNPGVIGLVAGKIVEEYYRPCIVLSIGDFLSKGSARSITGFNMIEAIRTCTDLLVDVGGHPMAAGFTVETKNIDALKKRLEDLADTVILDEQLVREIRIDAALLKDDDLLRICQMLGEFKPFGFGNVEPVFALFGVKIMEVKKIGKEGKHVKLKIQVGDDMHEALVFNGTAYAPWIAVGNTVNLCFTLDMNTWNGRSTLQLKARDIKLHEDEFQSA